MNLKYAKDVIKAEAQAIESLVKRVNKTFHRAVELILNCKGHVVVTGMGKAGIIAQKISATFASTGTPSIYLHPVEACHGDLGRIVRDDIVLVLSNSGETPELIELLPRIKEIGGRIISITSRNDNSLGKISDVTLEIGDIEEPCPLKLAPSASTAAMLALGDTLALCVLKKKGFGREDFAFYHPGGLIGKRFMKVSQIMRKSDRSPVVSPDCTVKDAILKITSSRAGAVSIADKGGRLLGIFTDGDLRRGLTRNPRILQEKIKNVMTKQPIRIAGDKFAYEAALILSEKKIDELPVVGKNGKVVGMLDVQDLLELGII